MIDYPMDKYKYYVDEKHRKVIAVSTYAGRSVRGIAKADPRDTFDLEKGKVLAAKRCNEKVAKRRYARAQKRVKEAARDLQTAQDRYHKMLQYMNDAHDAYGQAEKDVILYRGNI